MGQCQSLIILISKPGNSVVPKRLGPTGHCHPSQFFIWAYSKGLERSSVEIFGLLTMTTV